MIVAKLFLFILFVPKEKQFGPAKLTVGMGRYKRSIGFHSSSRKRKSSQNSPTALPANWALRLSSSEQWPRLLGSGVQDCLSHCFTPCLHLFYVSADPCVIGDNINLFHTPPLPSLSSPL